MDSACFSLNCLVIKIPTEQLKTLRELLLSGLHLSKLGRISAYLKYENFFLHQLYFIIQSTLYDLLSILFLNLLVRLIGVNKGRHVTLKYFSILIKVSRKHRLFIGPRQSISLICKQSPLTCFCS